MKIVMKPQGQDEFFFDQLSNLSFSPETDLSGNKLPSNTFECDVHTNYQFEQGMWVELQDNMDNLFARYWLVDSVYKGRGKNGYISVYHIKCESPLGVFDKIKMPAKMYNTTAQDVLTEILQAVNSYGVIGDIIEDTVIADDFTGTNVTGFCPEQTARERLQWLLLLTNSYIKNFFDASIRIKRMTTGSGTMIPIEKTYWKPELTNRAYVTKIVVHGYTFTQGTPQNTDQYVTDGTTTWIVTDQRVQITNTNVPNDVPENIVEVEGVMILTPTQASIVASNLAVIYFNRVEVDAEVIDNAEYIPGDKVTICVDNSENGRRWQTGFIERVDFSFGTQAKGRLHIAPSEEVTVCELTVVYMWDTIQLAVRSYFFPYSYPYRLETDFLDQKITGHRYVFRPNTAIISGTITGDETVTVQCAIALDGFTQGKSDRTDISAEFSQLKTWIMEHYSPMLSSQSLTDDYKALLLRDLNTIISQINEASVLALEGVSDHEQALHVVSVDGLETSEDQDTKVLYINGDHRIDGWDEGEEDVPDQPAPEPTPEPEPTPTYKKGKNEYPEEEKYETYVDLDPWGYGISTDQYVDDTTIVNAYDPSAKFIMNYGFYSCPNLKTASFPECTVLAERAFWECFNLERAYFPKVTGMRESTYSAGSVSRYYGEQFINCEKLSYVYMPELRRVANSAFRNTGLRSIDFPELKLIGEEAFQDCVKLSDVKTPKVTKINAGAFGGCPSLKSLSFPELSRITGGAFWECKNLVSVYMPKLESLGAAFKECEKLSNVNLPNVSTMEDAFQSCHGLQVLSLPKLKSITEFAACEQCFQLSRVYFSGSSVVKLAPNPLTTDYWEYCFSATPMFNSTYLGYYGSIIVPASMVSLYKQASEWQRLSDRISSQPPVVPSPAPATFKMISSTSQTLTEANANYGDVTFVYDSTFYHNTNLRNVSLPKCRLLGMNAFFWCTGLTSVYLPELLSTDGGYVFASAGLKTANLPKMISNAGGDFIDCVDLETVSMPLCEYVGVWEFRGCTNLKTLSFPKAKYLDSGAFEGCKKLESVYLMGSSMVSIASPGLFFDTPMQYSSYLGHFGSIYVPASLLATYKADSYWSEWYSNRFVGI